ncbi:MAG: excinuclease ABC subunit C [Deltaproteobacteria bacterium]|nr:excinuclease ABC subunit C [Deltaproteobacteria bacterium]
MKIQEKISHMARCPGVYLMKDKHGHIIYVGKAKNLKVRVQSYFNKDQGVKTKALVSKIKDIECFVTDTEAEALILESTLIKKHKPRYNITFKDDKTYPYIKVTVQQKWPGIYMVRNPKDDGALYFGPYSSVGNARSVLRFMTKVFPIRDCTDTKFKNRTRPCLSYDIGRCTAPCVDFVKEEKYHEDVESFLKFLKGNTTSILKDFKSKMVEFSKGLKYEEAALIRDRILSVHAMMENQKVVSSHKEDQDIIAYIVIPAKAGIQPAIHFIFLFIRGGSLISKRIFHLKIPPLIIPENPSVIASGARQSHSPSVIPVPRLRRVQAPAGIQEEQIISFLTQYYENQFIPDEIVISFPQHAPLDLLQNFLSTKKGKKVRIITPQTGEKKKLLSLALQNLEVSLSAYREQKQKKEDVLLEVQKKFYLKDYPHRIECFDISNIQGAQAVGSMVVFQDGEALKQEYRKYKIKTVEGIDDFAMMREVLTRRYSHSLVIPAHSQGHQRESRKRSHLVLPDLIIVDGGKGQLGVGVKVLEELHLHIDIVGLAKKKPPSSSRAKTRDLVLSSQERIYKPARKNPIMIKPNTSLEHFIARVRDEAHRFAITYHRKLRSKKMFD